MNLLDYVDGEEQEKDHDWSEVPAARFLSWPVSQQLAYCAARDYASAAEAETAEDARWFLERAQCYEGSIKR